MINSLVAIFIKNITGNNIVLYTLLGVCPLILYQITIKESLALGIIMTVIIFFCTHITLLIYNFIILPLNLDYLKILSFIITIYLVMQLIKSIFNKINSSYAKLFDTYPEFFYTNFAVYGSVFLHVKSNFNFLNITVNSLGTGIGYLVILVIFNSIKERLSDSQNLTRSYRIFIELIILGLMSLVFVGTMSFR